MVTADPAGPASMQSREAYEWFSKWEGKCPWVNDLTLRTYAFITEKHFEGTADQLAAHI